MTSYFCFKSCPKENPRRARSLRAILLKNFLPISEPVLQRQENTIFQWPAFIFPLTLCRRPTPFLAKPSHTIIPPPQCFIVVFRHSGRYFSPCLILTGTGLSLTRQNLLSSVKRTLLQSKSIYLRAHAKRFLLAAVVRRCFFLALQHFSPLVCSLLLTVLALALTLYSFLRSFAMTFGVFLLFLRLKCFMVLSSRVIVIFFLPLAALATLILFPCTS